MNDSRYLFYLIKRGYSSFEYQGKTVYLRHPSEHEVGEISHEYEAALERAKKGGIPTRDEKIKQAVDKGWWKPEKEAELELLRSQVSTQQKTIRFLQYQSQKDSAKKELFELEERLNAILNERATIICNTAEDFATKLYYNKYLLLFLFEDENLTRKLFDPEYDDIPLELSSQFYESSSVFDIENIERLGASIFFIEIIKSVNSIYEFWGKFAVDCSHYQIQAFNYGKRFHEFLRNHSSDRLSEVITDPDKFIAYVNDTLDTRGQKERPSAKTGKAGEGGGKAYFTSDKKDLERMGVKVNSNKIMERARKNGGKLTMNDVLK